MILETTFRQTEGLSLRRAWFPVVAGALSLFGCMGVPELSPDEESEEDVAVASSRATLGPAVECTPEHFRRVLAETGRFVFDEQSCLNTTITFTDVVPDSGGAAIYIPYSANQRFASIVIDGSNKMKLQGNISAEECTGDTGEHGNPAPVIGKLIRIEAHNVRIRNLRIAKVAQGIHVVRGIGTVIDNIQHHDICEDSISVGRSRFFLTDKTSIKNSSFKGFADKALHVYVGRTLVKGNVFEAKGTKGKLLYSGSEDYAGLSDALVYNNQISGAEKGPQARGSTYVFVKSNTFRKVKYPVAANKGATLVARNNNAQGCSSFARLIAEGVGRILLGSNSYDCARSSKESGANGSVVDCSGTDCDIPSESAYLSDTAGLSFSPPLPTSVTVPRGGALVIDTVVTGAKTYRWYRNDTVPHQNINGTNVEFDYVKQGRLVIANVTPEHAGTYRLRAMTARGSILSNPIEVVVTP